MDETTLENMGTHYDAINQKENMFFPTSEKISREEFDSLPREAMFSFGKATEKGDLKAKFMIRNGQSSIALEMDHDMRLGKIEEELKMFQVQNDGKRFVFPPVVNEEIINNVGSPETTTTYHIDGLRPRELETDSGKIEKLDIESAARILKETEGSNLIFYTGAGISMGGEKPVWGMAELHENLGIDKKDLSGFTQVFNEPLEYPPADLLEKVNTFRDQLFGDESTPAHIAIADIINSKEGSVICTENADLKHEAEGSRLSVIHMGTEDAFLKLKLRANDAKLLVTVGLRIDDRAVINYLKQQNPDLKIIAFTLSEDTIPNYLDENDAVVLGNVQEVIPKVAERILLTEIV